MSRPALRPGLGRVGLVLVGCGAVAAAACGAGSSLDGAEETGPEIGGPRPDLGSARPERPGREGPAPAIPDADHFVLRGGEVVGLGVADVEIRDGRIVDLGQPSLPDDGLPEARLEGYWIAPAFIDSHVHLAYWDVSDQLGGGGLAAVVDLAAPVEALAEDYPELDAVVQSGPMITAPGGYPLDSWGAAGFGLATDGPDQARANVADLAQRGASLIKIPIEAGAQQTGGLDDATLQATIDEAHLRGMKVAAHALSDAQVRRAGALGADVLAHAPLEPLAPETLELWRDRAVIPTLDAFGPSPASLQAVEQLRGVNATVLYGTDLGNARIPAISDRELDWMSGAGMDPEAILASGTSVAADFWGLDDLGRVEVGARASLLILASDPTLDEDILARPSVVLISGEVR